jgi:hypothetical protein
MTRTAIFLLAFVPLSAVAQVRVSTLKINSNETYQLAATDILVADTLIMEDSSRLRLNGKKSNNYIHAKVVIIGNHCLIDGRGENGLAGKNGGAGKVFGGPCRDGGNGRTATKGDDGKPGVNLFLYLEKIIVNGTLIIDLAGGNGGDGGNGGEGGGGSPGTLHCKGGNGGTGGDAGYGGNGGNGGTVTFSGNDLETVRLLLGAQIVVNSFGGNFGYGGIPGTGGSAGLGPGKNEGRAGTGGRNGSRGRPGNNGGIQFEQQ